MSDVDIAGNHTCTLCEARRKTLRETSDPVAAAALLLELREDQHDRVPDPRGDILPALERIDFFDAGHFIGAQHCYFTRHTHVARWCISSVGDCWFRPEHRTDVGLDRAYESMVFDRLATEDRWGGVAMYGYATAEEAAAGHEALVAEWAAREAAS